VFCERNPAEHRTAHFVSETWFAHWNQCFSATKTGLNEKPVREDTRIRQILSKDTYLLTFNHSICHTCVAHVRTTDARYSTFFQETQKCIYISYSGGYIFRHTTLPTTLPHRTITSTSDTIAFTKTAALNLLFLLLLLLDNKTTSAEVAAALTPLRHALVVQPF